MATDGFDVHGLNVKGIAEIKDEINNWVKEIESVNIAIAGKQITGAVKGAAVEQRVKKVCQRMSSYVSNLTNELKRYNDILEKVKQGYATYDSTESGSLSSLANRYSSYDKKKS